MKSQSSISPTEVGIELPGAGPTHCEQGGGWLLAAGSWAHGTCPPTGAWLHGFHGCISPSSAGRSSLESSVTPYRSHLRGYSPKPADAAPGGLGSVERILEPRVLHSTSQVPSSASKRQPQTGLCWVNSRKLTHGIAWTLWGIWLNTNSTQQL